MHFPVESIIPLQLIIAKSMFDPQIQICADLVTSVKDKPNSIYILYWLKKNIY